jgi:hypothetical protein
VTGRKIEKMKKPKRFLKKKNFGRKIKKFNIGIKQPEWLEWNELGAQRGKENL